MSNHINLAVMSSSTATPLQPPLVGRGASLAVCAVCAAGAKASAALLLLIWALVACGGVARSFEYGVVFFVP